MAAMSDLGDLFKVIAQGKKHYEETDPVGKKVKEAKEHAKSDLDKLFEELSSLQKQVDKLEESNQEDLIVEDMLTEEIPAQPIIVTPEVKAKQVDADVSKYLTGKTFQQPNPDLVSKDIDAIRQKMKFLEQAIGRIAASGPGGGEVNLRWLDDVDRSTIYDMRFLRYNDAKKKFEFAEVNPHDIVYNTYLVTTPTYLVNSDDYYVGVNYAGPTTITLPTTLLSSGRKIIIKDESGNASTNPITVLGTVDNDAGGFIIQVDNGGIQLIYRSGWRII
jgi:hypothetical protein